MGIPRPRTLALLYALSAPWDVVLFCLAFAVSPLFGWKLCADRGVVWLRLPAHTWLAKRWRYSTTLGHIVLLQERAVATDVEDHELVHVRQFEGAVLSVWLAGACFCSVSALVSTFWASAVTLLLGPFWSYFGGSLSALLRAERPYLDNHFERHARAEVALFIADQASSENGVKSVPRS